MKSVTKRDDHTSFLFFQRTVAAQIHLIALLAAVCGLAFLLYLTWHRDTLQFWACLTFGLTAICVFATSSVYHFLSDGYQISERLAQRLEDLDHFSIYLFIAGTYTPVLLNTLKGQDQYTMIFAVWGLAFAGIAYTHFKSLLPLWMQNRFFSTGIFLMMGWIALFQIRGILSGLSHFGTLALALGAVSYSVGAVVYATKRPILIHGIFGFHELWHALVVLGFTFHYLVVLNFYFSF